MNERARAPFTACLTGGLIPGKVEAIFLTIEACRRWAENHEADPLFCVIYSRDRVPIAGQTCVGRSANGKGIWITHAD
jgi:hypothetical protein